MANAVLLASSLLAGLAHLAAFLACVDAGGETLAWALAVLTGVATSVWNHATTSETAKWVDRVTVACCVCLDALFLWAASARRPTSGPVGTTLLHRHQDEKPSLSVLDDPWAVGTHTPAAGSNSGAVAACAVALLAAVGLFGAAKALEHRCHRKRWVRWGEVERTAVGYLSFESQNSHFMLNSDACHATSHVLATVLHVSMATLVLAPSAPAGV